MDSQLIRVGRLVFPSVVALMGKKKFKKISEKVADDLKVLSPAPAQVVVETAAEDSKKSTEVYDNTAGKTADEEKLRDEFLRCEAQRVVRAPHLLPTPATDAFKARASRGSTLMAAAAATPPPLPSSVGTTQSAPRLPIPTHAPEPLWRQYLQPVRTHTTDTEMSLDTDSSRPQENIRSNQDNNARNTTLAQHLVHNNVGLSNFTANAPSYSMASKVEEISSAPNGEEQLWRKFLR